MPHSLDPDVVVDNRYKIESELGRGGMGLVYLAWDVWLQRQVAIKLIHSLPIGEDVLVMLRREAAVLAGLRSEFIVQVHAFGVHEQAHFFAMEYVAGESLEAIILEHARHEMTVPLYRAITIVRQVASGLAKVHAVGLVHRDVKPANIVVEEDSGRPVLIDFGLAAISDARAQRSEAFGGTPAYMAPEQTGLVPRSGSVSPLTDVYALGCSTYELLTGHLPFEDKDTRVLIERHARGVAAPVSFWRADLTPFDAVVARAMEKAPEKRYPGPVEFAEALEQARQRWRSRGAMATAVGMAAPVSVRRPEIKPPPERATEPRKDPPRVLQVMVVDDDPAFQRFAAKAAEVAFGQGKVDVAAASSGQEALELAQWTFPQLVILEYDMPDLNGVETLSRLRALPGGAQLRVVVASSHIGADEEWQFSVLGVRDFLPKPMRLDDLVAKIGATVRRSGWIADISQDRGATAPTPGR